MPMVVGVPKEIKPGEFRAALTPDGARALAADGTRVLVEPGLGKGSGFPDAEYASAGALLVSRDEIFARADLLLKVKEPLPEEFPLLREGQAVFTFLHLAPNRPLIDLLVDKRIAAFAYETLEDHGALPLLAPMSEIAGRMAPIMAGYFLGRPQGGRGVLPAGATGVAPADCAVVGAGMAGRNAAHVALALGMRVTVMDRSEKALAWAGFTEQGICTHLADDTGGMEGVFLGSDAVILAAHRAGHRAPLLITRALMRRMRPGSVIVDVSIDQGGSVEGVHPTTHADPVYADSGVLVYAVANMPGAYPRTATLALCSATLPYARLLARLGPSDAVMQSPPLRSALNTFAGGVTHPGVASSAGLALASP